MVNLKQKSWKQCKLGTIAEIIMGQSPSGANCNDKGKGIPLLNGPTEFGKRNPNPVQYTSDPKKLSRKGDLLFCVRGSTTGRMNWSDQEYAIGRGLAAIGHFNGFVYQPFLKAIIDYNLDNLLAGVTGSTFPNVSYSDLTNIEIHCPPLSEQKAIASVLSSLDDKIDLLHSQNQTLEALAETIFRQWFIAEEDKKWKELMIFELIDVKDGTHDSPKPTVKGYKLVTSKHLKPEGIDFQNAYYIAEEDYNSINKRSRVEKNDILISMIGTLGLINFVREDEIDYAIKNIGLFKTSQKPWLANYLYFLLRSPIGKNFVKENAVGSTQEYIPLGSLRKLQIKLPPSDLMEYFNNAVDPTVKKVDTNKTQIRTLEALRDTLLPKLMSGEVRVQYDKDEVEKVI